MKLVVKKFASFIIRGSGAYFVALFLGLSLLFGFSDIGSSAQLDSLSVFKRCYSQLTQSRIPIGDTKVDGLISDIKSGKTNPIDACISVLERAKLNAGLGLAADDSVSRSVLGTMHDLHASWFRNQGFPQTAESDFANEAVRELFDPEQPALYFTRALFDVNVDFSSVMTSSDNLAARRTNVNPIRSYNAAAWIFTSPIYAEQGELTGMTITGDQSIPYSYQLQDGSPVVGNQALGQHFGSGFMGSQAYILSSVKVEESFQADGGIEVPRKWSKSIFNDLMCRDLPAVRSGDASSYVDAGSAVLFRKTENCIRCHVSMDQMAAGIRGFKYKILAPREAVPPVGGFFADFVTADLADIPGWPSTVDPDYYRRPSNGLIYYRDHTGTLVQVAFDGLNNLGAKLAEQPEPYLCLAKRYYEYFIGISVDTGDVADPGRLTQLSAIDITYRDQVITAGMNFKNHKDPVKLIKEILSLSRYGKTNVISNQ